MESLGQFLRAQRGTRGMSLEEVATRTRIRFQTLDAMERDDYAALPAEVTVKGFLRSYARCLGLDEAAVLQRYRDFAAEYFQVATESDPMARMVPGRDHIWQNNLTLAGVAVAALMVLISGVALWSPRAKTEHPSSIASPRPLPLQPVVDVPALAPEPPEESPAATVSPPQPAPKPSPTPAATATPVREAAVVHPLVITASEPTWIQAVVDDGETKEALMQPGERIEWSAERHVRLTVGNAGGASVEFDGQAVPSLGASGAVRTIVLPKGAVTASLAPARPVAPVADTPSHEGTNAQDAEPPALTSPVDSTTVPPYPR